MRNSRLQQYALVAEVMCAAVVVVSIAFLVAETRDNTKAINVQTHFALTEQINTWRESLIDDDYISAVERAGTDGVGVLSASEESMHIWRQLSSWSIYGGAYFAHANGWPDANGWRGFSKNICRNFGGAALAGSVDDENLQAGGMSAAITDGFRSHLENNCRN